MFLTEQNEHNKIEQSKNVRISKYMPKIRTVKQIF